MLSFVLFTISTNTENVGRILDISQFEANAIVTEQDIQKYQELGEKEFRKDCLNRDKMVKDMFENFGKDFLKKTCDSRTEEIKNITGTSQVNQFSNSSGGPISYLTHDDYSNGISLEFPSDWTVTDGHIYKGTHEFTITKHDEPIYSLADSYNLPKH